jgi:hypothetical protein
MPAEACAVYADNASAPRGAGILSGLFDGVVGERLAQAGADGFYHACHIAGGVSDARCAHR